MHRKGTVPFRRYAIICRKCTERGQSLFGGIPLKYTERGLSLFGAYHLKGTVPFRSNIV